MNQKNVKVLLGLVLSCALFVGCGEEATTKPENIFSEVGNETVIASKETKNEETVASKEEETTIVETETTEESIEESETEIEGEIDPKSYSLGEDDPFHAFFYGEKEASYNQNGGDLLMEVDLSKKIGIQDFHFGEDDVEDSMVSKERVDLDNDGEQEIIIYNCIDGGRYLDCRDGEYYVIAEGCGTGAYLSYVEYQGSCWIQVSDTTHAGRSMRSFYKLDGTGNLVDSFNLDAEYWDQDSYDENSDFNYRGEKITMEQYEALLTEIFPEI